MYITTLTLYIIMKKKSQVTQTESPPRDELVELLANELNKANKDGGKVGYFLDEQENLLKSQIGLALDHQCWTWQSAIVHTADCLSHDYVSFQVLKDPEKV